MAKLTAEKIFAGPLFAMSSAITVSLIADLTGYFPFEENALFVIKPGPLGKVFLGFWCVVSLAVSLHGLSKKEDK